MLWHWSTDIKKFKKENPEGFRIWRLEYLINYGIQEGEKLDKKEVVKYWDKIKDNLDPDKKKMIEFFIWGKKWRKEPGLRSDRKNFWQWYFNHNTSLRDST